MNIKSIFNKFFYNPKQFANKNKDLINISESTKLTKTCRFDVRKKGNSVRINIGRNNILGCRFILESNLGYIEVGDNCFINGDTKLISRSSIKVGNYVTMAWGITIYDHDSHSLNFQDRRDDINQQFIDYDSGEFIKNKNWDSVKSKPIVIEDDVWIGMHATILKGVIIGKGAIIGAHSVVTKNVPPFTVVAGNPAKIVKHLEV